MELNIPKDYTEVVNFKIIMGQGKTSIKLSGFTIIEDGNAILTEEGKQIIGQIRSDIENLLNQYNKNLGGEINGMVGDNEETNITDHGQVFNEENGRKEKDIHNEQLKGPYFSSESTKSEIKTIILNSISKENARNDALNVVLDELYEYAQIFDELSKNVQILDDNYAKDSLFQLSANCGYSIKIIKDGTINTEDANIDRNKIKKSIMSRIEKYLQ